MESTPVQIKERAVNNEEMPETFFDQKCDMKCFSHKIQSKDREMKRYSKILVKYRKTKRDLKNNNALKTKRQG